MIKPENESVDTICGPAIRRAPTALPSESPTMQLDDLENAAKLGFMWIGFGTVVGLAAKAIMPGRDPGGAVATLLMGVTGTVIGCSLLKFFYPAVEVTPISILGFSVGTGGAFLILAFYKVLGGYWFTEGETGGQPEVVRARARARQRRRINEAQLDE